MKHLKPLFNICALCLFGAISNVSYAEKPLLSPDHIVQTVRNFSKAVQAKDTNLLLQAVSSEFAVSVGTLPLSLSYMQTIFDRLPIDSVVPVDGAVVARRGEFKQKVEALVHLPGREAIRTLITFDAREGKILYVDYFDGLFGMFRNRPSRLMGVLPFEQKDPHGAIIVRIKINNYDQPLRFLFDSGADGMAISAEAAERAGVRATRQQGTQVVGGNRQVMISAGNTIHLVDSLQMSNQNMAIFERVSEGIDGLLGLNLARNYIIRVDFDEQNIYLYSHGDYTYAAGGEVERVTVPKGIIHIPGYLNLTGEQPVEGNFVFDTGADYYLMAFSPWVARKRLLQSGWTPDRRASTVSMGMRTPTAEGVAHEFAFGHIIRKTQMPVALQTPSPVGDGWDPGADGSVGIRLLSHYNFTINLVEKEVHFSLRSR